MKNGFKVLHNSRAINIFILIVVTILLGYTMTMVRSRLMQNTHSFGDTLVQSYALEEDQALDRFIDYSELASLYVNELDHNGASAEEIQAWLQSYFVKLSMLIGQSYFDAYAVVDGSIIAANPWEGDEDYPYWEKDWYTNALEADGATVITDGYTDVVTGNTILSVSKELSRDGDVMVMDLYVSDPSFHGSLQSLPEGSAFYVCDQKGTVLYAKSQLSDSPDEIQEIAYQLLADLENGTISKQGDRFQGSNGLWYGVYRCNMEHGWTVLITIPFTSTLMAGDNNRIFYATGAVSAILFAMMFTMLIRDTKKNQKMKEDSEIIRILGNSFFGVVRINVVTGTYKVLKVPAAVAAHLPKSGPYHMLLESVLDTVTPDNRQDFELSFSLESIRQRAKEGVSDYGGDFLQHMDGEYRWVNTRTMYVPDILADEVIWCFRDVDAEKRQQMQHTIILKDALDAARKSTKAKSEFFSNMSHDMRTPLNAVIGCTMLAQKAQQSQEHDKVLDYLGKIEYAGNQLLNLINDILELSRIEAGKNTLEEKPFNIKVFLSETIDLFQDAVTSNQKTLTLNTEIRNQIVVGDSKKIGQILNNLVSNAVKYTNQGDSILVEVRQFEFKNHSKFQIVVEDTGIGMSRSFLDHLFDPYARETSFSQKTIIGIGLGMPIVKSLVQQLSGEISVESTLGQGSRFTVTIPLKVAEDDDSLTIEETPVDTFNWSGRRVLLAEDNELNMEIASNILALHDVEVIPAKNGVEAVQIFQSAAPYSIDLILMDMQMPEMDGCDAARVIRGLDKIDAQTVPIIAVTANAFAEDIAKTTKAGMNGHVSKPINFTVLSQTVSQVMKRKG